MKTLILICTLGLLQCREAFAGLLTPPTTQAPAGVELRDQFDAPQKLTFPTTNLTLLAIADRKGSEQIAGWIAPVEHRFGKHIDIRGLADVSAVPGPLRGMIRKKFQKSQSYPVMMDWSGEAVLRFGYVPGQAEILLLDRDGKILQRFRGAAGDRTIHELRSVIERTLTREIAETAAP